MDLDESIMDFLPAILKRDGSIRDAFADIPEEFSMLQKLFMKPAVEPMILDITLADGVQQ